MIQRFKVSVGEKAYEVTVESLGPGQSVGQTAQSAAPDKARPATAPSAPPAPTAAPTAPATPAPSAAPQELQDGDVASPLAGKVISIEVRVGELVQQGDQLLTIEAMKMNTYVYAPCNGIVTAILAAPGDGVEHGQVLAQIKG